SSRGVAFDADGAIRGMAQQPFDRDRARTAANVPKEFARARLKRRERDGPDLALGALAVMLEHLVGHPGRKRDDLGVGSGLDLDGDEVQRIDIIEAVGLGFRGTDALTLATQGFEHVQNGGPKAALSEIAGDGSGCGALGGETERVALRLQQRPQSLDWTATKGDGRRLVERPAELGAG